MSPPETHPSDDRVAPGSPGAAPRGETLTDCLRVVGAAHPDEVYGRYLFADREPVEVTFGETLAETRELAAGLARHGVGEGDLVLVVLEHHQDLMSVYLAAMWLGAVPAFLPHPNPKIEPRRYYANLRGLIANSRPAAIVTRGGVREMLRAASDDPSPRLLTPRDLRGHGRAPERPAGAPGDVALVQYSSGSTGQQKGAALSHRAVLAEIRGVGEFFEISRNDAFITWVPLYHDWGLVCVALHALSIGSTFTLLSPLDWIRRPVALFEAVERYRPTIYYLPNFAFNFTAQRVRDDEMEGIDLGSLRLCCNGAEPCFWSSHRMFVERFAPWGLDGGSLGIVYGMAEVTNSVVAAGHREPIRVDVIDRDVLQRELRAAPVPDDHPRRQRMLGVGRALAGTELRIVDDDRREVDERRVGEVALRSRAGMDGYHRNRRATAEVLDEEGWYYSGDMGYRVGEVLFITGRKTDMIIAAGVNIYPQDIEEIVAEHPDAVAGRIAAIGVDDAESGTQAIVVIVESKSDDVAVHRDIAGFARREVAERLNVALGRVVHAPHRWLIKTSSGKIARKPNLERLAELERPSG